MCFYTEIKITQTHTHALTSEFMDGLNINYIEMLGIKMMRPAHKFLLRYYYNALKYN